MKGSVCLCLFLVAVMWGTNRGGHAHEIVVRPNVRSPACPNGNVYMQECNKCFCKVNVNNSTHWPYPYCRKAPCDAWTCPDPPSYSQECEGLCECDAATAVTFCEKYCEPKMQGVGGVKNRHPDREVEQDVFV